MADITRFSNKKLLIDYLSMAKDIALMELALKLGVDEYTDHHGAKQTIMSRIESDRVYIGAVEEELLARNVRIDL